MDRVRPSDNAGEEERLENVLRIRVGDETRRGRGECWEMLTEVRKRPPREAWKVWYENKTEREIERERKR